MSGETFADLLAPTLPALRKFVTGKMRMSDRADDVVQQTLLRAYTHRHQLRAHSKFKSWLSSIAMNEIRMLGRQRRASIAIDDVPGLASTGSSACPYHTYHLKERAEHLHAALARLNDRDRDAILLIDFEEVRLNDAARALAVSPAALKSTHFRARQRLGRSIHSAIKLSPNEPLVDPRVPSQR